MSKSLKVGLIILTISVSIIAISESSWNTPSNKQQNTISSNENVDREKLINDFKVSMSAFAKTYCEEQLVAPSTAKFPWALPEFTTSPSEKEGYTKYTFESYVDSQNKFGAMIRTNYRFSVETDDATMTDYINSKFEFLD